MFRRHRLEAGAALLISLAFLGAQYPAIASKGGSKVEAKSDKCDDSMITVEKNTQTARFGNIPMSAKTLVIVSESANVVVKRVADGSEITVASNCPRNWAIAGSQIRQAGFSGNIRKGSSLLADELGSRAIVNGLVYLFPPGPLKGLKMGADGVFMDGKKLEPLKGSEIPCNCSGEDLLVVSVPQSFTGDLKIGSTGKSKISISTWKDGALDCVLLGESSLSAGKLDSLPKVAFDNKGRGSAEVNELDAKIFVASTRGNGNASILIKKGKAQMSNATVEGNGTIELHGNFEQLKKLVEGSGKIEVNP